MIENPCIGVGATTKKGGGNGLRTTAMRKSLLYIIRRQRFQMVPNTRSALPISFAFCVLLFWLQPLAAHTQSLNVSAALTHTHTHSHGGGGKETIERNTTNVYQSKPNETLCAVCLFVMLVRYSRLMCFYSFIY